MPDATNYAIVNECAQQSNSTLSNLSENMCYTIAHHKQHI